MSALKRTNDGDGKAGRDPLHNVAAEHILDRLREAQRLVEGGLSRNLTGIRDMLEEAMDQTDAWVVTRLYAFADTCNREDGVEPPVSRLRGASLARASGDPAEAFLLIPFGVVNVERPSAGGSFEFTQTHAQSAKRWFDQLGRKLAIDYEHQSFDRFNLRPDGLRPAAGWVGGLEIRDDGLWAVDVTWTERAAELLRSGEYRYFSPVIFWTDAEYSDVAALGPVALTNDPAMHGIRPLAASRASDAVADDISRMSINSTDADSYVDDSSINLDGDADEAANGEVSDADAFALRNELATAQQEIEVLRRELLSQEADTFVERGLRLGKILESTSLDWRDDYLRDAEQTESRLQRAPVLLPPGRVIRLDERGRVAHSSGLERGTAEQVELHTRWGIEPADLEAYDRANAAGRVRRMGVSGN